MKQGRLGGLYFAHWAKWRAHACKTRHSRVSVSKSGVDWQQSWRPEQQQLRLVAGNNKAGKKEISLKSSNHEISRVMGRDMRRRRVRRTKKWGCRACDRTWLGSQGLHLPASRVHRLTWARSSTIRYAHLVLTPEHAVQYLHSKTMKLSWSWQHTLQWCGVMRANFGLGARFWLPEA